MISETISILYERINYTFARTDHIEHALTRTAYVQEHGLSQEKSMDALAVLGDAVLDVVVVQELLADGEFLKGEITRRKTNLVNMTMFRRFAESIGLPDFVSWGKGEREMRIWESGRVAAECFEALAGAAYLDGGIAAVESIFRKVSGFLK